MSDLFGLWPHQESGVASIEKAWSTGTRSICFQLSTGGGKSRIIRQIVDNHANSKNVIYIIAHRKQLVKQLSEEIDEAGIKHGLIASGKPYIKYRVQVCSVQTLVRRVENLPAPDLIIYDECHHIKSTSAEAVIKNWPEAKILGVTATPRRTDGKPLSDIFDKMIVGPPMRQLMDDGYLSDYEYFAPNDVSMDGAAKRGGDYAKAESASRVDKQVITGSAVEHYRKYADHLPAIACCVTIAHADHVCEQFVEAGYKAVAVHSGMDALTIERSITGLRNGSLEVLCQCEMLGEGVDIKGVVALIMLRPTASLIIFLQQCGRALRKAKGKDHAIILDHVGNWERHGLPDDERTWDLLGRTKKEQETSALKSCPGCLHIVPVAARVCPHCGYQWTETEAVAQALPEEKEGKLISIKSMDHKDKNELAITIARKARNLKQAVSIAKGSGVDHRGAFYIWTKLLKNSVDKGETT